MPVVSGYCVLQDCQLQDLQFLYMSLVTPEIDIGQGKERSNDQRAIDNTQNSINLKAADNGEKNEQGVHFYLGSHHFGFDEILDGKRENDVENEEENTFSHAVVDCQDNGGRDHYQADTENGEKGENGHDRPPQQGRVQPQDGEDGTAKDTLDKAADTVSLEDGIGDFLKFFDENPVFIFR